MPQINITGNQSDAAKRRQIEAAYELKAKQEAAARGKSQEISGAFGARDAASAAKKASQEDAMWKMRSRQAMQSDRSIISARTQAEIQAFNQERSRLKQLEKERTNARTKEEKAKADAQAKEARFNDIESRKQKKEQERSLKQRDSALAKEAKQKAAIQSKETRQAESESRRREKDEKRQSDQALRQKLSDDRRQEKQKESEKKKAESADKREGMARRRSGNASIGLFGIELSKILKGTALAVGAAVEAPLIPGQLMRGVNSLAGSAMDLKADTFGAGRAGGFPGMSLYRTLFPGSGQTKNVGWLTALGLTPEKAMQSLGQYGIAPRSSADAAGMISMLGTNNMLPGFSGMEPFTAEKVGRQAAGYGASPSSALSSVQRMMMNAVADGMDRAKVLDNIQAGIDVIAKSGAAGISYGAVTDTFSKFASLGTPGGRSGASALGTIQGMSNFAQAPLSNLPGFFMLYSSLSRFNNLKSPDDINNFLGPNNVGALNKSPAIRDKLMTDVQAAIKAKNLPAALNLLTTMGMTADPTRIADLQRPGIEASVPSYLRGFAGANAAGISTSQYYGLTTGKAESGSKFYSGISGFGSGTDDNYRDMLINAGVPANMVGAFVASGRKYGINPALLASIAKNESGFNPEALSSTGATGLMQIDKKNSRRLLAYGSENSIAPNIDAGAQVLSEFMARNPDDLAAALSGYSGGAKGYSDKVMGTFGRFTTAGNIPFDVYGAQQGAAQTTLQGSETALDTFVPIVNKATQGLEGLYSAAATLTQELARVYGYMSALPGSEGFRSFGGLGAPKIPMTGPPASGPTP